MSRLTRTESQARTREQLVSTAEELFLAEGYQAVPLARVAERAGFSTGAVYSNFSGKAELALAVLDRVRARVVDELRSAMAAIPPQDRTGMLAAFSGWAQRSIDDSAWFRLELEFALEARSDPALVALLAERHRALRDELSAAMAQHAPPSATGSRRPHLAGAMLSLGVGLAVQRMIDPQVTVKPLLHAMTALFAAPDR